MKNGEISREVAIKPQPKPSLLSKKFWDAANSGDLIIQRCRTSSCGEYVFYPRVCCPHCHEDSLSWVRITGKGTILSNTTIHRTHHDGFNIDAPYVFAAVKLSEGPCIYGQVHNAPIDQVLIGRSVMAGFEPHGPNQKIVVFNLR